MLWDVDPWTCSGNIGSCGHLANSLAVADTRAQDMYKEKHKLNSKVPNKSQTLRAGA